MWSSVSVQTRWRIRLYLGIAKLGGQPDPGYAGEGGKQPRQRRNRPALPGWSGSGKHEEKVYAHPAVTAQICALEKHTCRTLLRRLPRGVKPSPYAHELAVQISAPLDTPASLEGRSSALAGHAAPYIWPGFGTAVHPSPARARAARRRGRATARQPRCDRATARRATLRPPRPRDRYSAAPRASGSHSHCRRGVLLVASPCWAEHAKQHRRAADPCAALRDVPLVAYVEDLPIVRRYWRSVVGQQLSVRAAVTVPNLYAVVSAVNADTDRCSDSPVRHLSDRCAPRW